MVCHEDRSHGNYYKSNFNYNSIEELKKWKAERYSRHTVYQKMISDRFQESDRMSAFVRILLCSFSLTEQSDLLEKLRILMLTAGRI